MIRDAELLLQELRGVHASIRDAVVGACERQAVEQLSATVAEDGGGDTIFVLDRVSEDALLAALAPVAARWCFVLVAEGLSGGRTVLPRGRRDADAELTIIVDPIDGTRGLMYQKRSAWVLTGVAPLAGTRSPTLHDIELAIQTEIPLVRQHLCDQLWVLDGSVAGEQLNRLSGERTPLLPRPSRSDTTLQGFGGLARFFPGGRDVLAAIDDAVAIRVAGDAPSGRALAFEDQYISTGGQLYELLMGHDRWIADLRPLIRAPTPGGGLCCHPYDLCTESIARAAGVIVTDASGAPLAYPLDVTTDCAWIGFANAALRDRIFPVLVDELSKRRLLRGGDDNGGDDNDLAAFERLVRTADLFGPGEVVITRAPGRLDVMGGIADYSGSLVLELPLAAATFVAAQLSDDRTVTVRSLAAGTLGVDDTVSLSLDQLCRDGRWIDYAELRTMLSERRQSWAAYVLGALPLLAREHGARIVRGVRLLVDSRVPAGKGVASSAALEVAALRGLCELYDVPLDGRSLALACQRVENFVVGAPCGVMDQMTSACGTKGNLLAIRCQPAEIEGQVAMPDGLELWGIDSGIRHEVGGAEYGDVRVGAFMGHRIMASVAGADTGNGYLANVEPSSWARSFRDRVPESMRGVEFLHRYGDIADSVTRVDAARTYAVRQPTAHPIHEHHRVRLFRSVLENGARTDGDRRLLGELMYQSHASYSACGLGSRGTDHVVALARSAEGDGVYGAKITGGGSGGVVAVLARAGSRAVIQSIADRYARESGMAATVLGGSSAGAMAFGARRVRL